MDVRCRSKMSRINFLSLMTADAARHRMRDFDSRYKRQWQAWLRVGAEHPLVSEDSAQAFRRVLSAWQAVRSTTKGRVLRPLENDSAEGDPSMRDLLREAAPFVDELGQVTLREARRLTMGQRRALSFLWDIFRDLPTVGTANAVGITKAVKLVTLGRIGPALDKEVRRELRIGEPRSASEWIEALAGISDDLARFERATRTRLEQLVELRYRPIAVGRAYDMVAGPRG